MGLCGAYGSVNGMTAINSKAASDGRHIGSAVHTIHAEIDETIKHEHYDLLKETQLETIETGLIREMERSFLLQQIDYSWKEHLQKISYLRDSIRWRAYGQRDPLTDYKKESFNFFVTMLTRIRHRVIYFILRSKIVIEN